MPSEDHWSMGIRAQGLAGQRADAPSNISREGPTGVEGTGGSGGPGCGAGGRWLGLALVSVGGGENCLRQMSHVI